MFVLQKRFIFARGLNWDQSCLWKTPPSHFLLFSPLVCPYFSKKNSSPDFWGVKKAPCKKFHVFGENWQRNHFPKLTTLWLLLHPCYNFPIVQCCVLFREVLKSATKFSDWSGPSLVIDIYIDIEYRLSIYRHFWKILISIWSFLKISISTRQFWKISISIRSLLRNVDKGS